MTKIRLPADLNSFSLHDLRKIAHLVDCHAAKGPLTRDEYLKALAEESTSVLAPAMDKVMGSGTLNQPDESVEIALGVRVASAHHGAGSAEALALVQEVSEGLKLTQEGVRRFAEDVDARVEKIEALARQLIDHEPLRIRIEKPSEIAAALPTVVFEGAAHREFTTLLSMARAKVNILMVGPAGSGKTTAAEMLSKALGIEFRFNGAIDTEYKLKGFVDAQGRVVNTAFRDAFENGGVYLFDEVDASLPAATMAFNSALANGWCDFPDKRIVRHPDTVIIAAANTFLGGATFEYVGRNKQDAAFIDRFVTLGWDVDEALEEALCPNEAWCKHVQRIRANAKRKGLKVIVSPRASFEGAKMLAQGLPWDFVEKSAIRKGMTEDQWTSIK
jgi:cobaltochelatase CobS